jgi:hypothetical protein
LILTALSNLKAQNVSERIYVQTDKHLYLAGETVLMKLFTTDAAQIPMDFSKIAYIELFNESAANMQIMVEISGGIGTGQMQLSADFPTGYYRLIAYTQMMRNEGIEVFFEKEIAILNTFLSDYNLSEQENQNTNFQTQTFSDGLSLQSDRTVYTTRQNGELIISNLPENVHTLSATITTAELIDNKQNNRDLYNNIFAKQSTTFSGDYLPEYEGHIITGQIISNNPTEEFSETKGISTISLPSGGLRFFVGENTGENSVRFITPIVHSANQIATSVLNADDKFRVDIISPFVNQYPQQLLPVLHIDSTNYDQILQRSVALQLTHYFSDNTNDTHDVVEPFIKQSPTNSYPLDEYTRFATMREVFVEIVQVARFRSSGGKRRMETLINMSGTYVWSQFVLVLLDGVPITEHQIVFDYDPTTIKQIDVYSGQFVFGGNYFEGIVELTTYRRLFQNLTLPPSTQVLTYQEIQPPYRQTFIDYSTDLKRANRIPDSRHTLLWKPDIKPIGKTDIKIPFSTSDLKGNFEAHVEGVTTDGQFIFGTFLFSVQ